MAQEITEGFRFSPQQKRVWFLQQQHKIESFRTDCLVSIIGQLDAAHLATTLTELVAHHEILRTTFHYLPGLTVPVQVISDCGLSLQQFELTNISTKQQSIEIERILRELKLTAIDLQIGPILHVVSIKLADEKHLLAISLPALSMDIAGLTYLITELFNTLSKNHTERDDEPMQYADLAEWQHELLASDDAQSGRDYWRNLDLRAATDHKLPYQLNTNPNFDSTRQEVVTAVIEPALMHGLNDFARAQKVELSVVLQAGWQLLLARLAAANSLTIGSYHAGRTYQELTGALGLFAKFLPIHCRFDWQVTFPDLLNTLSATLIEASELQEFFSWHDLSDLIEQSGFNFNFEFHELPRWQSDSLTISIEQQSALIERSQLALVCLRRDHGVTTEIHFNCQQFDRADIERLIAEYHQLLKSVLADPQLSIGDLEIVSDRERQQLLIEFNDTSVTYANAHTIHQLIEQQIERTPSQIAIVYQDRRQVVKQISYRELGVRANMLAHYLRARGAMPDQLIGLCIERSVEMVVAMLAILKSGAAYLPLDAAYPAERIRFMLADADVKLIVTNQRLLDQVLKDPVSINDSTSNNLELICIDRDWRKIELESCDNPSAVATADNLAYVIYTSGSTGKPKGAMIEHRGLVNYLSWCVEAYRVNEGIGAPVHSPIGFDLTVTSLYAPLLCGGRVELIAEDEGIEGLANLLRSSRKNYSLVKITPAHMQALSHLLSEYDILCSTRALIIGGEALRAEDVEIARYYPQITKLINEYGPTETVVGCSSYEIGETDPPTGAIPIGRPIANTQLYILDDRQRLLPIGVTGELYIGGAGVCRGYLNRAELTAEKFIPSPFNRGARLYRTGDLARYRRDGVIEFLGRIDEQVKVRGYRIELGEIEASLLSHCRVRECAVVVKADHDDKRLIAFVRLDDKTDNAITTNELKSFLRERLPEYMLPAMFVIKSELPLTPNGKVDRKRLAIEASQPLPDNFDRQSQNSLAAITPEEEILTAIWANALNREQIGVDENFFDLGGDSIRSIQVMSRARERGLNFTIDQLFQHPTARRLAQAVKLTNSDSVMLSKPIAPFSLISAEDRDNLPADLDDAFPLSMLQRGMLFHSEFSDNTAIYHDLNSYHLEVEIDLPKLQIAIDRLIARHAILRASFELSRYAEPLQLIHKTAVIPLIVTDISELSESEQEIALNQWMAQERMRRIDYWQAPLLRFYLHRRAANQLQFTMSFHHAILDGWSSAALLTELFENYFTLLSGRELAEQLPLATSFCDFIAMEREIVASSDAERFWQTKLNNVVPMRFLRLSQSAEQAAGQVADDSPRVYLRDIEITAEISLGLNRLARSAALPLKSVLLAAHLRVMSLLAGSDDVITGMVTNSRLEVIDGERVLGLFLNTLPIRQQLNRGSWLELVKQTFENERELMRYRRYPLALIQQQLGNQLPFETNFNFNHFHVYDSLKKLPMIKALGWRFFEHTNFTLTANFFLDLNGEIHFNLNCNEAELSRDQIEEIAGYYAQVLRLMATMATDTECSYQDIELNSSAVSLLKSPSASMADSDNFQRLSGELAAMVAPRNPIEEALVSIWCELLRLPRVGINDNFFELGGHSLIATRLVSRLRELFQLELSLRALFESPTIAKQAELIAAAYQVEQTLPPPIKPVSRDQKLPLSFAQQRLWFLDQLTRDHRSTQSRRQTPDHGGNGEKETGSYLVPAALQVHGKFDIHLLEKCFKFVIERHEVLRTSFDEIDGEPVQLISAEAGQVVRSIRELDVLPPKNHNKELVRQEREQEITKILQAAARYSFELSQPLTTDRDFPPEPLLRVVIIILSEDEFIISLTMHHIISDGWSMNLLVREITACYQAFKRGETPQLPRLPIQYADFAQWQREWLQGAVLARQLDYWRGQLKDRLAPLPLPTDRPRPAIQSNSGARVEFKISPEITRSLRALSRSRSATLFITLMASFQALLSRYIGHTDHSYINIGTPISGRNYAEIENLIGFFVNTLVISGDLSRELNFLELLAQLKETILSAYAHQDLPFERIVAELQPTRDMSHAPIFQVMFVLQNTPVLQLSLPDLEISLIDIDNGSAKFDLTLAITERDEELVGYFEYNCDLFDAATIERMSGHYHTLLQGIVTEPRQLISQLPLLTTAEQQQLLIDWNCTERDYPCETVIQLFEAQVARTPDSLAVIFNDLAQPEVVNRALTYQELNQHANQLARFLRRQSSQSSQSSQLSQSSQSNEATEANNSIVAVMIEPSLDLVIAILAVLKAGYGYLPIDVNYPAERINFMLSDARPTTLLTQAILLEKLASEFISKIAPICLDRDQSEIIRESQDNIDRADRVIEPDSLAYLIYTSGSTGRPKGVMIEHDGLSNLIAALVDAFEINSNSRVLQFASISFDASVSEIFTTLIAGAQLHLASRNDLMPGRSLVKLLQDNAITVAILPPSALAVLPDEDFPALTTLIVAGEACSLEVMKRWSQGRRFLNAYGPTETTVCATISQVHESNRRPSIGRPIANTKIYLFDKHLQPVPIGVPAEVFIGGVGVARGYLNRTELTVEKFIVSPFDQSTRLYRTGDLARYLANGEIEFIDRIDEQLKVRGFRIEPGEIESALNQHSAIKESVVIARGDGEERRLIAYLVIAEQRSDRHSDQETFSIENLRDDLKTVLPDYLIPSAFVVLAQLPLTPNGKIDRKALKALPMPVRDQANVGDYLAPRNQVEAVIASIWAGLLGIDRVGVLDNFFVLGGHSLLATQLASRLRDTFQIELSLSTIFATATLADLAEQVMEKRHNSTASTEGELPINVISRNGDLPVSFAQHRLWFLDQLVPGNSFFNAPAAIRFDGWLDKQALKHSLNEIVRRHEALRANFIERAGQPLQIIRSSLELPLPLIDLTKLDLTTSVAREEVAQEEVRRLAMEDAHRPFNLATDPLVRATLLRVSEQQHVLLLTMHHIVSDGWSLGIFINELTTIYQAFLQAQPSPLPELAIQYVDYAAWQRARLQGDLLVELISYWRKQLMGSVTLQLPIDHPRPAVQTFRGATKQFKLSQSLTTSLNLLSRREGSTLFITLLAAFYLLLYRYSGHTDISIGTPVANRNHSEIEPLIGLFFNTIVLRVDLGGDLSFRELLKRVREVALAGFDHQELPFEQLVEELQPERDLSRTPLYQVVFALQNLPIPQLEFAGLKLSPLDVESNTSRTDLTLVMIEQHDQLIGSLEYSSDLFDDATITRMIGHYQTLLNTIVVDVESSSGELPIEQLPLLTVAEQQQILVEWNNTAQDYHFDCVHHFFEDLAESASDNGAVLFEDQIKNHGTENNFVVGQSVTVNGEFEYRALTYQALNQRANQLAHRLRREGVGPDCLVGICLTRSLEMVIAIYGIWKAGGAYVPIDPGYPAERIAFMLADAKPIVLLTQADLLDQLPEFEHKIICLDRDWPEIAIESRENPARINSLDQLAYMIYTSGSTGRPKGTMNTHRGLYNRIQWMQQQYQLTSSDHVLQKTPFSFDVSVWEFVWPLITGATLVVARPEGHKDSNYLIRLIDDANITTLHFVPSMLQAFLTDLADLSERQINQCRLTQSLRHVICSGEALSFELQQRFFSQFDTAELHNLYGPTEASIDVSYWECRRDSTDRIVPIGRAIANTQLYILDRYQQPLPVGIAGELYIGGIGLARGYHNRPDLTAEKFIRNPFSINQFNNEETSRLYRTGDLARYLADGNIEFLGRIDHQVKIRGFRIELGEIEATLERHPAIHAAVVVARGDHQDKQLIAYLVADNDYLGSIDQQSAFRAERVSQWQTVYDDVYRDTDQPSDETIKPHFNIKSWINSYTGEPFSLEQMREWVDDTVNRILALYDAHQQSQLKSRLGRVLEIGCGTGLLLFRLAPESECYTATDLSTTALAYLSEQLMQQSQQQSQQQSKVMPPIKLHHCAADQFEQFGQQRFDTIIINSVAQYFPDLDYLLQVIEQALIRLAPGGALFLGDLRSLPLLEIFYTDLEILRADQESSTLELKQRIAQRIKQEEELVIDPILFFELKKYFPSITTIEFKPKQGFDYNEMTRFRYDLIIHITDNNLNDPGLDPVSTSGLDPDLDPSHATSSDPSSDPHIDPIVDPAITQTRSVPGVYYRWREKMDGNFIRTLLTDLGPTALQIISLPDARVAYAIDNCKLLSGQTCPATVAELQIALADLYRANRDNHGIDPAELFTIASELNYQLEFLPAKEPGRYDILFQQTRPDYDSVTKDNRIKNLDYDRGQLLAGLYKFTSQPLRGIWLRKLKSQLRGYLKDHLPEYMIPSAFLLLDALPLSPNGKVDRNALPAPERVRRELSSELAAATTETESALLRIEADLLGLERIGINDNFFELGGHSLLATQLISRVRERFNIELSVRALFETPTIAGLAKQVDRLVTNAQKSSSIEYSPSAEQLSPLQLHPLPAIKPTSKSSSLRDESLPLSFAQQRLWFLDRLTPNSAAYNLAALVRMDGVLDEQALIASINEIVRRHEVLRTVFGDIDGQPIQIIKSELLIELPLIKISEFAGDVEALTISEREAYALQLATKVAQQPFDLAQGPLIRARLLCVDKQRHILLLVIHHIISDGWSMGVTINELAALYQAFSQHQKSQLPELLLQYVDFAGWQRQWLNEELLNEQIAYWRTQLHNLAILQLPLDRPRPPQLSQQGATVTAVLPIELSQALQSLSVRNGVTLFITLMSGFQLLLGYYSKQDDIVVGTDIANRRQAELEQLIGFFVNQLVIRTDLSGDPTFVELLIRVREIMLSAYNHQDLPFDLLVKAINPVRDRSRTPLFQVKLILQNTPQSILSLPGLTISAIEFDNQTAKFDLLMNIYQTVTGLKLALEYNTDIFNVGTIERILVDYQNLLQAIIDQPDIHLSELRQRLDHAAQVRQHQLEVELEARRLDKLKKIKRRL